MSASDQRREAAWCAGGCVGLPATFFLWVAASAGPHGTGELILALAVWLTALATVALLAAGRTRWAVWGWASCLVGAVGWLAVVGPYPFLLVPVLSGTLVGGVAALRLGGW